MANSSSSLFPATRWSLSDPIAGGAVLTGRDSRRGVKLQLPSQLARHKHHQPLLEPLADAAADQATNPSRRERCRINQTRYRERQRKHAEDLNTSVRELRQEVQSLEGQRQTIANRVPTRKSVWVVTTEYFRLFRRGFLAPVFLPESVRSRVSTQTPTWVSQHARRPHPQLAFLEANMVQDVTDGVLCGAEAILDNWKLLSLYHDDVHVHLERLEQVADNSLLATTTLHLTITENTLHHVYNNTVGHRASRLLNQRLVIRGSVRFDWDDACGRVVRLESKLDMLTPMLELLGSLEDVARVFEKAQITLEGKFLPGVHFY